MELSWLTRIKITAAVAIGVLFMAGAAWPMISLPDPHYPISLHAGVISFPVLPVLAILAAAATAIAYFAAWPYGPEVSPLAVPAGLAALSLRGGSTGELFQMNPTAAARGAAYMTFAFESAAWLAIILVGFATAYLLQQRIHPPAEHRPNAVPAEDADLAWNKATATNAAVAVVIAAAIAWFALSIFVQSISTPVGTRFYVHSQPRTAQIAFGVAIALGVTAFAVKLWFNLHVVFTVFAATIVSIVAMSWAQMPGVLENMVGNWPANTFARTVFAVTPLQTASFGTVGAITGYWLAIRLKLWRTTVLSA